MSRVLPSVDMTRNIIELLYARGILIPLKILELELLDSLSWVFVVGFVVAVVVVVGNWLAVRTWTGYQLVLGLARYLVQGALTLFTVVFSKIVVEHEVLDALLFFTLCLLLASHSNRKVRVCGKL